MSDTTWVRRAPQPAPPAEPATAPPETASDAALLIGVTRGNRQALAALFERHAAAVYGLASVLCGAEQGSEVLRSTFLELWRHPESFDPDSESFQSYLLSIAFQHSVHLLQVLGTREHNGHRPPSAAPDAEAPSRRLDSPAIAGPMLELPSLQRDAIVLALFGRHNYREVATMLRKADETINQSIRDGLTNLRALPTEAETVPGGIAPGS